MTINFITYDFTTVGASDWAERAGSFLLTPAHWAWGKKVVEINGEWRAENPTLSLIARIFAGAIAILFFPATLAGLGLKLYSSTYRSKAIHFDQQEIACIREEIANIKLRGKEEGNTGYPITLTLLKDGRYRLAGPAPGVRGITLSGGGTQGIAYVGLLEVLYETGLIYQIKGLSGSSAGAMAALLITLTITPNDFKKMFKETDWSSLFSFLDEKDGVRQFRDDGKKMLAFLMEEERKLVAMYLDPNNGFLEDEKAELPEPLVDYAKGQGQFTFKDAETLRSLLKPAYQNRIKRLYIPVSDIDNGCLVEYCFENTPDYSRAKAAQESALHPFIFQPDLGKLDAGLICNTPVFLLEKYENKEPFGVLSADGKYTTTNLNLVFSEEPENVEKCPAHQALRTMGPPRLTSFDLMAVMLSDTLSPLMGNQNYLHNRYLTYQEIRNRSPRTLVINADPIYTLQGLLPGSDPPTAEEMDLCIARTHLAVKTYLDDTDNLSEELYYDYDSLAEVALKWGHLEEVKKLEEVHEIINELEALAGRCHDCADDLDSLLEESPLRGNCKLKILFLKRIGIPFNEEAQEEILRKGARLDLLDSLEGQLEELIFKYKLCQQPAKKRTVKKVMVGVAFDKGGLNAALKLQELLEKERCHLLFDETRVFIENYHQLINAGVEQVNALIPPWAELSGPSSSRKPLWSD